MEWYRGDLNNELLLMLTTLRLAQSMLSDHTIRRGPWDLPHKFHLYLIFMKKHLSCPVVLNPALQFQDEREKLLFGLPYDGGKKKIPISVSKIIALLFTETSLKW